jgi:hypothetical protein
MFVPVLVTASLSGHSQIMRCRALLSLVPLLALLAGCAGSTDASDGANSSTGGNYTGGQTGSLIPNCGIAPLTREGGSVPSGEQAFVLYTQGCPPSVQLEDIVITDASGAVIDVELEALADGTFLVKGSAVLSEGQYNVVLPMGVAEMQATLEVAEAAALPTTVGELQVWDQACDQDRFALQLDPALLPYLPLVQFSYTVDDGPLRSISNYGVLGPEGQQLLFVVPHCLQGVCLTSGRSHRLSVSATIAGETNQPDPASTQFQTTCVTADDEVRTDDGIACAVRRGVSAKREGPVAFLLLAIAGLIQWRGRQGRRRKQEH